MINKDEKEVLYSLVAKFYHSEKTKIITIPPQKENVTKTITEEIPKQKTEYLDKGPTIYSFVAWGVAFILFALALTFNFMTGILFATALALIGFFLFKKSRKIEKKVKHYSEFVDKEITEEKVIEGKTIEEKIPNSERILVIRKLYIPFEAVRFATDDSIVVSGPKEIIKPIKIEFPTINKFEEYYKENSEMSEMTKNVPYVLNGDVKKYKVAKKSSYGEEILLRGFEKELQEKFIKTSKLFNDTYNVNFTIPIVNNKILIKYLKKLSANSSVNASKLKMLSDYINSREGIELEQSAKKWLKEWDKNQNILHYSRFDSLNNKVSNICFDLGDILNYSAFNFYCPECNSDKANELLERDYSVQSDNISEPIYFPQSTRCLFNTETNLWKCKTCEHEFEKPIPLHKCYDEILIQAYDRLMDENKNQRLKAHNDTRNKEVKYMNDMETEIEKLSYENLSVIYSLTDEMEKMKAEIMGENEAINSLNEVSRQYRIKQNNVIKNINDYCHKVNNEIAEQTKKVLEKVNNLKENEMKKLDEELTQLSKAKRKDDEARDMIQKQILGANVAHMEIARRGFNKLDERLQETNQIAKDGFNKLDSSIQQGNEIAKDGFSDVTKAVNEGTKNMADKIHKGNSIQAAIAKKEGINLHDESFLKAHKILSKAFVGVTGKLLGKSSVEIEGDKLNV